MKKEGLLVEPEFENPEKYLQAGERTELTEEIKRIAKTINGESDGMVIRNVLVWMHQNTQRMNDETDNRKFKRTADEVLKSKERTGCCDSSTLFVALARSKNIPTMQIITVNINENNADGIIKGGHYFAACYLKGLDGKYNWALVDSDRNVQDAREVVIRLFDKENRNIGKNVYAIGYVRDYRDIIFNGMRINSSKDMETIQTNAFQMCNKSDFDVQEELEK